MTARLILAALFFLVLPLKTFAATPQELKKASDLNKSAIQKMKDHDLDGAEVDLLQALEYSDQNEKLKKNLSVVYYEKGVRATEEKNFYDAEKYLKSAIENSPDNERFIKAYAASLSLEADSRAKIGQNDQALELYKKAAECDKLNVSAWTQAAHYAWMTQKLEVARDCLDQAKKISPEDKNVLFLEEKMNKSTGEVDAADQTSLHFILSREAGNQAGKNSGQILSQLEEIYNSVSYELNYFPQNKFAVIFYPTGEFHDHWKLPARVNGYYDGKLRIPHVLGDASFESTKPMIRHELAHAFISTLTHKPIPQWMNEGIAQWVEGKEIDVKSKDALVIYQITKRVPDIAHLDAIFLSQHNPLNNTEMTLAYMKSFSLIQYLVEEHGVWSLIQFIKNYETSTSTEELFKKYFLGNEDDIENHWIQWLERKKSNFVFN